MAADTEQVAKRTLSKGQLRQIQVAAGLKQRKVNEAQRRIARSTSMEEAMQNVPLFLRASRGDADAENAGVLAYLWNGMPHGMRRAVTIFVGPDNMVKMAEKLGLKRAAAIRNVVKDGFLPFKNRLAKQTQEVQDQLVDFQGKSRKGSAALTQVQLAASRYNVNPSKAPTAEVYAAQFDQKVKELRDKLATEKDPKKRKALETQLSTRREEINSVYEGSPASVDKAGRPVAAVPGWYDLAKKEFGGGEAQKLFTEVRNYYHNMNQLHFRLVLEYINEGGFKPDEAAKMREKARELFKPMLENVSYFPAMRFGQYWVSVDNGKEFYMAESERQAKYTAQLIREENPDLAVSTGFGHETLREAVLKGDSRVALKKVLDFVDALGESTDAIGSDGMEDMGLDEPDSAKVPGTKDILRDQVYQLLLTTMPQNSLKRGMQHRKFVAGFSVDGPRVFAASSSNMITQFARLKYTGKLNRAVREGYTESEGKPNQIALNDATSMIATQAMETIYPAPLGTVGRIFSNVVAYGSKYIYIAEVVNARNILLNWLHLPSVGLPGLAEEFGTRASTAMALKFAGGILTGERIMQFRKDADGNVVPLTERFSFADSKYIEGLKETDPNKYRAFKYFLEYADEREMIQSTFMTATGLYENAEKSGGGLGVRDAVRHGEYATAAMKGAVGAVNLFSTLDQYSQTSSRQIFAMSAFELAYDREIKNGASPQEARDKATALAEELTNRLMFQYAESAMPMVLRHPAGRPPFFLLRYGIQLTTLFAANFAKMVSLQTSKRERLGAIKMFLGTSFAMTAMGGITTSFAWMLFSMGHALAQFVEGLADDDEGEEPLTGEEFTKEFMRYANEKGYELAERNNLETYIRMHLIPDTFGPGGTVAGMFDLSDETGMTMQKLVEQGLFGAAFDIDITDSLRVDQVWSPAEVRSDRPETQLVEFLGNTYLGAMVRGLSAPIRFYDELSKGEVGRAIEAIAPKFVKDYARAQRQSEEGVMTGSDRNIQQRGPEEFSPYNTLMQALGFLEADSRRESRLRMATSELTRELQQERTDLLDRRFDAMMAPPSEESERELRRINRAVQVFNANYPSASISEDDLEASFSQKFRYMLEREGGQYYDPRFPVAEPLVDERMREQVQE